MGFYQNSRLIRESNCLRMDISRAAYVELNSRWKYHGNSSAYFTRVYFVSEGEADILCNDLPYKLQAGNVYIIPAGTPYCYDCKDRLCKLYFQVNLYNSMGEDLFIAPKGCIVLEDRMEDVQRILTLFHRDDYGSALAVRQMVEQVLCEAMLQADSAPPIPHYSAPIQKALRLMSQSPSMALTVSALAETVFLSPASFQRKFQKEVGIAPIKYLRARVIAAAQRDLQLGDLSLREISEKYGFCDQFHFSRVFTAHVGVSPSGCRKEKLS